MGERVKPKVLLGIPIKGSPLLPFVTGLMECIQLQDAHYIVSFCPSTYVQAGRNHCVGEARKHGCDELIFCDADMAVKPEHILKLRSHDVDIVGGLYCKRKSGEPEWTCHATGGPAVGDLIPVNDTATGLLRIKMRVFDKFDEVFTGRKYQNGDDPTLLTEYFPMGLTVGDGWQHPAEAKLEAISALLRAKEYWNDSDGFKDAVEALMAKETPSVHIVGEDCSFCRMAKHAGFQAWVDATCQIRHVGEASYPLVETPLT
jgi:hypothetical protein